MFGTAWMLMFGLACTRTGEDTPTPSRTQEGESPTAQTRAAQGFDQAFLDAKIPHHAYLVELSRVAAARGARTELRTFAEDVARTAQGESDRLLEWRRGWYGSAEVPGFEQAVPPEGLPAFDWRQGWGAVERAGVAQQQEPARGGRENANGRRTPPRPERGTPDDSPSGDAPPSGERPTPTTALPGGDPSQWTPTQRVEALRATSADVDLAYLEVLIPVASYGVDLARAAQTRGERAELREFARSLRDTSERTLEQARRLRDTWSTTPMGTPPEAPAGEDQGG